METAEQVSKGGSGSIKVGFSESAAYDRVFSSTITDFQSVNPNITLNLSTETSFPILQKIKTGEVDIGFIYDDGHGLLDCKAIKLSSVRTVLAVPKNHHLSSRKSVNLDELNEEKFVWAPRESNPHYVDAVAHTCSRRGLRMNVVAEAPSDTIILSMVSAGAGITFVNELALNWKPQNIKMINVRDMNVEIKLYAVWLEKNPNPCLRTLIAYLGDRVEISLD